MTIWIMDLSDEDMEMCSDDENAQDNVIEVNVKTSGNEAIAGVLVCSKRI